MYDEVRIYYTTLYVTYDRGEAMNTVLACLQDFQTRFSADKDYHYEDDDTDKKIFLLVVLLSSIIDGLMSLWLIGYFKF